MIKIIQNPTDANLAFMRKPFDERAREAIIRGIIDDVKKRGDEAVKEYGKKFDGYSGELLVSQSEIDGAYSRVSQKFIDILIEAKSNIEAYHTCQKRTGYEIKKPNGIVLGQKITPIEKVGIYVPGGTAAYPSTVLMNVVPALVAGCKDITLCTPPSGGKIKDEILAAAKICGINKVLRIGGAQAIAAMAYGTESITKVDKIVGPGNIFVALAKKAVFGDVGIDTVAGPSEILIIADKDANADYVAADLLSQAEHDALSTSVLITNSIDFAAKVQNAIERQLKKLPREQIARKSIDDNGVILVVEDISDAAKLSNEIAPEHLELYVKSPMEYMDNIKNAGSIFIGGYSPEPLGDYFAGPNHTLPTGGNARFSSPLSVDDFEKKSSYIYYTKDALLDVADKVAEFATREGLNAHANAVLIRRG